MLLLGIAERRIHVKFDQTQMQERNVKPLPTSIQTIGDWIRVSRTAKNLTPGHVAAKMGIAHSVIRSWEDGATRPDSLQLTVLEKNLRLQARIFRLSLNRK